MKSLLLAGLAFAFFAAGCHSTSKEHYNHWNNRSISQRMSYHFLGYNPVEDGSYRDFDAEQKKAINLTMRRHLLNSNPYNPLQPWDPSLERPRRKNSLLPYPWNFIHAEGLVMGAIMLNPSVGAFIPIPVGSLVGVLEPGGVDEFMDGIGETFQPLGVVSATFLDYTIGERGPIVATWTGLWPGGDDDD
jgi:hypothetical protein